jgi:hypothetical protein
MAFDFPSSPVEGQVFTPTGRTPYVYRGGRWRSGIKDPVSEAPQDGVRYTRRNGVWTSVGPGSVTTAVFEGKSLVDLIIPAGARRCRLTGWCKCNLSATNIACRVKKNSVWVADASGYIFHQLYQNQTTVAGGVTTGAQALISNASDLATLASRPIDADFYFPEDSSEVMQYTSRFNGMGGGLSYGGTFVGYCNSTAGPYEVLGILSTQSYMAGKLVAEFDA